MKKKTKRILTSVCIVLILLTTMTAASYAPVSGFDNYENFVSAQDRILPDYDKPEAVESYLAAEKGHMIREYEKEQNLSTVIFSNRDGTETVYIFNENVKYIDENGSVSDKSNELFNDFNDFKLINDYAYYTKRNDIKTYFPKALSNGTGVILEYGDKTIGMYPKAAADIITSTKTLTPYVKSGNTMLYNNALGANTKLQLEPLFSGFEKSIILESYTGNEFKFIFEADGLILIKENGLVNIVDEDTNEVFAVINPVYAYDSYTGFLNIAPNENHFSNNNEIDVIYIEKGKYEVIITVDNDFLTSINTVYPVSLSTTVTITSSGSGSGKTIIDTPIYNGSGAAGASAGGNPSATLGYVGTSYGAGRLLMGFPGLTNQSFMNTNYTITEATLYLKEGSGQATSAIIGAYIYTGPLWSESTVYSSSIWNGVGTSAASTGFTYTYSYPNSTNGQFNVLEAVRLWQNNSYAALQGIILKNNTSETSGTYYKGIYTSEGTTKPYMTVTYETNIPLNRFYSEYTPDKFNEESIQKRMNCYGYAFSHIYNNTGTTYKQQPGEFATVADKNNIQKNIINYNHSASMVNTVNNIKLDAKRFGYTVTEYVPGTSTVQQYGTSSRLIALVIGDTDYHFYMQHNDGTWSHKPGSTSVINTSLTTNVVLTNANIRTLANQGSYANGLLKFFIISKDAVIDYPHGATCCLPGYEPNCSHALSTLYYQDRAGDFMQTSSSIIAASSISGQFDFANDRDFYYFIPMSSRTYNITTTSSAGADIDCKIYDSMGNLLLSNTTVGQVNVNYFMETGLKYFIEFYNYNKTKVAYTFNLN